MGKYRKYINLMKWMCTQMIIIRIIMHKGPIQWIATNLSLQQAVYFVKLQEEQEVGSFYLDCWRKMLREGLTKATAIYLLEQLINNSNNDVKGFF